MKEALKQSIDNLRTNKLRSCLTMFGIMWGVISIVVLSALGEGFQRGNQAVLQELGKNVVIVRNGRTSVQAGGERAGRVIRLDIHDVHALRSKSRLIEQISPELMRGGVSVKSAYNAASLQMSGIWPEFQKIRTIEVSHGRLINQADNDEARRVVVIGREAAIQLFADRNPIGEEVKLNGLTYTVIGKIRQKFQDSNYTGRDELRLFAPYESMRRDFPMAGPSDSPDSLSAIIVAPYAWVADSLRKDFDNGAFAGVFGIFGQTMVERDIRRGSADQRVRRERQGSALVVEYGHRIGHVQQDDSVDEGILSGGQPRHAHAGRHRSDEHHAGRGARANPRDRIAQGARRHEPKHSPSVHHRRLAITLSAA
jgi:hypothetical protein